MLTDDGLRQESVALRGKFLANSARNMEFDVVISPGASADIDDLLRYVAVELCNPESRA